jgi:hypothetical protein
MVTRAAWDVTAFGGADEGEGERISRAKCQNAKPHRERKTLGGT